MNKHIRQLLTLLNDGDFHSGSDLGEKLNLTRSAIWKLIKHLEKLGIEIEAKTRQGYKISHGLEFLDKKQIGDYLTEAHQSYLDKMIIFDEISSTNTYLVELAKTKPHCKEYICLAESQTAGKGRLGRYWFSPYAKNIYLSLLWCFVKEPMELGSISIAVAVAIVEALRRYGIKQDIHLKWPNDVLWQQRKLAGILVEISGESHHKYSTVIGVGLNLEMSKSIGRNISQPWCDIAEISSATPRRNELVGLLLNQLLTTMVLFQKNGLQPFLKQWCELDVSYGKKVTLVTPQGKVVGIGRGINEMGHFLLEDKSGVLRSFAAGEVSLEKRQGNNNII